MSDTTQVADRFRLLAAEFDRRVSAVPADGWAAPSPCPEWTALDLVGHVVDSGVMICGWVGAEPPEAPPVAEDPVAAWRKARDAVQEILDDPDRANIGLDGMMGPTTVAGMVDLFGAMDLLIHGWDLARATGQDETLPADEVHRVHADALALGPALRTPGVCGPEVAVPADASEQSRLLGLLGRTPRPGNSTWNQVSAGR